MNSIFNSPEAPGSGLIDICSNPERDNTGYFPERSQPWLPRMLTWEDLAIWTANSIFCPPPNLGGQIKTYKSNHPPHIFQLPIQFIRNGLIMSKVTGIQSFVIPLR